MKEKYLPIGTVVMLKGGQKRLMIAGFLAQNEEEKETFDYIGILYPEGIVSTKHFLLFNHDDIEQIYIEGFSDEEQIQFKNKLLNQTEKVEISAPVGNNDVGVTQTVNSQTPNTPVAQPVNTPSPNIQPVAQAINVQTPNIPNTPPVQTINNQVPNPPAPQVVNTSIPNQENN